MPNVSFRTSTIRKNKTKGLNKNTAQLVEILDLVTGHAYTVLV